MIASFVLPVRCRSLIPAVELFPNHGCQAAIVQVRSAMPHAVGFANRNVIHLLRNVMIQAVLPDFGVRVPGDWEGRGALVCVLDDIEAGVVNRSEVEFRIGIPQPGR